MNIKVIISHVVLSYTVDLTKSQATLMHNFGNIVVRSVAALNNVTTIAIDTSNVSNSLSLFETIKSIAIPTIMHLCLYDFCLEVPLKTVEKREASFFFHCGATSTPIKRKDFLFPLPSLTQNIKRQRA